MKKTFKRMQEFEIHICTCHFCNDDLPENSHKLRRFCPNKFGIQDYCKNKYKELKMQERIVKENSPAVIPNQQHKIPDPITQQLTHQNAKLRQALFDRDNILAQKNLEILLREKISIIERAREILGIIKQKCVSRAQLKNLGAQFDDWNSLAVVDGIRFRHSLYRSNEYEVIQGS